MDTVQKPRVAYLDAARALGVLLVVLNHAANRVWDNYENVQAEFFSLDLTEKLAKTIFTVSSHLGVPLFLMITGALILSRRFDTREELLRFYRRNWLSLLITSEIWLFLGFWFNVLLGPNDLVLETESTAGVLRACLKTLLFVDQVRFSSMWYIPMIVSVYLMLPIFAHFLHHAAEPRVLLLPMLLLFHSAMAVPTLNAYREIYKLDLWYNNFFYSNLFSMYLLYAIAGWWIAGGGLRRLSDRAVALCAAGSAALCFYAQFWCYARSLHLLGYDSPGILICSVFLFELLRRADATLQRGEAFFAPVSRASFAVYLVHIFFNLLLFWFCDLSGWSNYTKLLLYLLVPLAGSALIIWPLSKIPFCRKYLFLIK